ncbi:hypothetical protein ENH_00002990 [Eimeria necatrix]|uniref:Uncharacterized protein n=1 Tax=Eimeria necatrix TaxID=51315 RepID=U6MS26_9EIME|nr:hypothetical protein ENH_00002990 [Eimeria necatrix]CDJ65269.1 hypothetical protein ENH_00002990 [Eimeria necatrix]
MALRALCSLQQQQQQQQQPQRACCSQRYPHAVHLEPRTCFLYQPVFPWIECSVESCFTAAAAAAATAAAAAAANLAQTGSLHSLANRNGVRV